MVDDNILDFTSRLADKQMDEYYESQEEEYDEYQETLHIIYDALVDVCEETGMASDEDDFTRDFAYVMEGIRALVDRQFGSQHPFHDMLDEKMIVLRDEYGFVEDVKWNKEEE